MSQYEICTTCYHSLSEHKTGLAYKGDEKCLIPECSCPNFTR